MKPQMKPKIIMPTQHNPKYPIDPSISASLCGRPGSVKKSQVLFHKSLSRYTIKMIIPTNIPNKIRMKMIQIPFCFIFQLLWRVMNYNSPLNARSNTDGINADISFRVSSCRIRSYATCACKPSRSTTSRRCSSSEKDGIQSTKTLPF
jgi:hypothetical protein